MNGLAIAGRIGDPAARQPWDLPGYVWMRAHLPADAVLLLPYGDPDTSAFNGRDEYFVDEILASHFGYSTQEVAARRAIVDSFFASDSLTPAQFAHLRTLGRPVYAVDRLRRSAPRRDAAQIWWPLSDAHMPSRPNVWRGRYRIAFRRLHA